MTGLIEESEFKGQLGESRVWKYCLAASEVVNLSARLQDLSLKRVKGGIDNLETYVPGQ